MKILVTGGTGNVGGAVVTRRTRECCLRTWPAQFIAEHASENRKRNLALNVP
jgi:uncharacterized protein YbjT (DUF2867 family)